MSRNIIVIGSEDWDVTTEVVMSWLRFYNQEVIRINMEDVVHIERVSFDEEIDFIIRTNKDQQIRLSNIKSFWLRRSEIVFDTPRISFGKQYNLTAAETELNRHLLKEIQTVETFLEYILLSDKRIRTLGANANHASNKLINLSIAQSVGLKIPETLITTSKTDLTKFINSTGPVITKTIRDFNTLEYKIGDNTSRYTLYTNSFNSEQLAQTEERFFPSLFQKNIQKRVELRIFYLDEKCFSMAIFSQQDKKTQVDFRRYNNELPNKRVPFNLPKAIERKLVAFMKKLQLNCGSIDMIYTANNDFIFLEVNPVGQLGMVSYPCNYYIEKHIAEYLK